MAWTDYRAPTARIPLGGDAYGEVRGLNIEDISMLLTNHLEPLSKAVQLYADSQTDIFTSRSMQQFMVQAVSHFPVLVTEVISLAADTPDLATKKLALGVQLSALNEITRLTLDEVGGLGNLSGVLHNLTAGMHKHAAEQRDKAVPSSSRSHASIGGSGRT